METRLNPATLELTRGIVAQDPVYFADKYVDSDRCPAGGCVVRVEVCKELAPEYQQYRTELRRAVAAATSMRVSAAALRGIIGTGTGLREG